MDNEISVVYDFLNLKILVSAPHCLFHRFEATRKRKHRVVRGPCYYYRIVHSRRGRGAVSVEFRLLAALLRENYPTNTGIKGRRMIFFFPLGKTTPVFARGTRVVRERVSSVTFFYGPLLVLYIHIYVDRVLFSALNSLQGDPVSSKKNFSNRKRETVRSSLSPDGNYKTTFHLV